MTSTNFYFRATLLAVILFSVMLGMGIAVREPFMTALSGVMVVLHTGTLWLGIYKDE